MSSDTPTSAERVEVALVDTSVAVAIVLADHEGHTDTLQATRGVRLGLAGHAAFETYSVLTRLPPGARRAPADVQALLGHDFPATRHVDADDCVPFLEELADAGIAGGAVYDALVGLAARVHRLPLYSRDRRARTVYDRLGVNVRFLG